MKHRKAGIKDHEELESMDVFSITGAAMMVRNDYFKKIGGV